MLESAILWRRIQRLAADALAMMHGGVSASGR
jgi:hypothetical protein